MGLPFNVWLLTLTASLVLCTAPIIVFCGSLIGQALSFDSSLSTLPVAVVVVGTASFVLPVTALMRRMGRKPVFISGALLGVVASLLAAVSLIFELFWVFCFACFLLGGCLAVVQQYRFAAMESVAPEQVASAAARILLGGLVAAYLGPEMALYFQYGFSADFAATFFVLAIFFVMAAVLLTFYRPVLMHDEPPRANSEGRSWRLLLGQPVLWVAVLSGAVGYAVMSFVMTATPLSMHVHSGHSLVDTKWVIQSHIMAMFLPSLVSGALIRVLGVAKVLLMGVMCYLVCLGLALHDIALINYWGALVLLGVGWNFLFVGGTSLLPEAYLPQEQYRIQGLNEFVVFGSQAIAALSSGLALSLIGWHRLLLVCFPFLLVFLLVMLVWRLRRYRNDLASTSDIL